MKRPRSETGREGAHSSALPLVNLVSILLPLGAAAAAVTHVAQTDPTSVPGLCDHLDLAACPKPPPPPPSLQLTVQIGLGGFTVASAEGVLSPARVASEGASLPCGARPCDGVEDYDYQGLIEVLRAAREAFPEEQRLTLSPTGAVPYAVIVRTMDAAQGEGLFPLVQVSRALL